MAQECREEIVRVLEIVVGPDCAGCDTARRLASELAQLGLPGVTITVVDLSEPGVVRPAPVFAVPTYVLDGRIISLGNPEFEWIVDVVSPVSTPVASPGRGGGAPPARGVPRGG